MQVVLLDTGSPKHEYLWTRVPGNGEVEMEVKLEVKMEVEMEVEMDAPILPSTHTGALAPMYN